MYGKTIVKMQFGSHVYGTNIATSDMDYKAIHIPNAADIILGCARETVNVRTKADDTEKNGPDDVDFESFSLHKFMKLLLDGQTVPLSMLFTPDHWILDYSTEWLILKRRRTEWLSRNTSAFAGYCRQQAAKYGIRGSRVAAARAAVAMLDRMIEAYGPLARLKDHWTEIEDFATSGVEHVSVFDSTMSGDIPVKMFEVCSRKMQEHAALKEAHAVFKRVFDEYGKRALMAETNEGVDWKAIMHALRVCEEAAELLMTGQITYPRREADMLIKVRKGELPYKEAAELLEARMDILSECQKASFLPETPNHVAAKELVYQCYRDAILRTE